MTRTLIVNADDLGMSPGVNRGIAYAHERGIVTSASLMVWRAGSREAAAYAREAERLSVGLHLDLGEWVQRDDGWETVYERAPLDDPAALREEVEGQLARFHEVIGRDPTHLDSHQHVHRDGPLREIVAALGEVLGIPVRDVSGGVTSWGGFHGQGAHGTPLLSAIMPSALVDAVTGLGDGTTELVCHPAAADDTGSTYGHERAVELLSLCHPSVKAAVERSGVRLAGFAEMQSRSLS